MSAITITEFNHLGIDSRNATVPAPLTPSVAEQRVELGLKPELSEPFQGKFIMIHSAVPIALAFGAEPEARAEYHIRSPGDLFYGVQPGHRLSVMEVEE